jgi:spore coat protein U-like protein
MTLLWAAPAGAEQCTVSTTPVTFGVYDVFSATDTRAVGSVRYDCNTPIGAVWITLSRGTGTSFSQRSMSRGAERLFYNLFRDAGGNIIWGDGTGGSHGYFDVYLGKDAVTIPVYGEMPAGQDVSAGTYTDTITVTVNF